MKNVKVKDPNTALMLSIFLGSLGIDRFYIGDVKLGLAKLFLIPGLSSTIFGIPVAAAWMITDWFLIRKRTVAKNLERSA